MWTARSRPPPRGSILKGGPVSTQRMLEFQLDILHLGFTHQMLGSVVAKTAQDIDQLVKMQ